jgi:hypothetical protein
VYLAGVVHLSNYLSNAAPPPATRRKRVDPDKEEWDAEAVAIPLVCGAAFLALQMRCHGLEKEEKEIGTYIQWWSRRRWRRPEAAC